MGWLFNAAIDWLAHYILDLLNALWSLLLQTALQVPNVTTLPQVQDITRTSLTVVNVCFVLAIVGTGAVVMGRETLQTRYGLAELGPRLVVGFIAANTSTLLCDKLSTVATVVLQALALHVALAIFLNPQANLTSMGLPKDRTNSFNLFIVTCLLWAVLKIPGLMRRYVTKGSTGAGGAGIGRILIVQQLTRTLTRVITKAPVRAPTGTAGRAAGGAGGAAGA